MAAEQPNPEPPDPERPESLAADDPATVPPRRTPAQAVAFVLAQVLDVEFADFPAGLLAALAQVIPVSFSGYYEVDARAPRIVVTRYPVEIDIPGEITQRGAVLNAEHPVAEHYRRTGRRSAVRLSDVVPHEEFRRSQFYRDVFQPLGIEHQLIFGLPGPEELLVVVAMSRAKRDFAEEERDLCELLREPLATVHAEAARTALLRDALTTQVMLDPSAAMITCEGDHLSALDDRAGPFIDRLQQSDGKLRPRLRDWLEQARAGDPVLEHPEPARHLLTWTDDAGSFELRHLPGAGAHDLLVAREVGVDLRGQLHGAGLRPREAVVLELVMSGLDNRAIAARLDITEATVKKHLEGIYRALGVSNRTAAAAAGFRITGRGLPAAPPTLDPAILTILASR